MVNVDKIVSVIMPTHNVTKKTINGIPSVNSTIQSFLNQKIDGKELIIIDDASSDESLKYLSEYIKTNDKNREVRLIALSENRGPGGARNAGLDEALGKYIFFLDADDLIGENSLKILISKAKHWNSDFILGQYVALKRNYAKYFAKNGDVVDADIEKNSLLSTVGPWGKLFVHDIITQHNIRFPEKLMMYEDATFLFEYLGYSNKNSISVAETPHYILRNNDEEMDNLTNRTIDLPERLRGLESVLSAVSRHSSRLKALAFERLFNYKSQSNPFKIIWDDKAKQGMYLSEYRKILFKYNVDSWLKVIPSRDIRVTVETLLKNYDIEDLISISSFAEKNINKWTSFYSTQPFSSKLREILYIDHVNKEFSKNNFVEFKIENSNVVTFESNEHFGKTFIIFQNRYDDSNFVKYLFHENRLMMDMKKVRTQLATTNQLTDVYVEYEYRNVVIKKMLMVNKCVIPKNMLFYKNWRNGLSYKFDN